MCSLLVDRVTKSPCTYNCWGSPFCMLNTGQNNLTNCVLMLQDPLPFVSGVCVKILNWLLPTGKHQGKNSLEAFSLGQAENTKPPKHNVSAILQRVIISSVSLTNERGVKVKQLCTLPAKLFLTSGVEQAEFSRLLSFQTWQIMVPHQSWFFFFQDMFAC